MNLQRIERMSFISEEGEGIKKYGFDFDENYFLGLYDQGLSSDKKHFVLIIYDISDNKRRNRMVKLLKKYGFRVQLSAFEILISPTKYKELIREIAKIPETTDSIRVYKIQGKGKVEVFGEQFYIEDEETIII